MEEDKKFELPIDLQRVVDNPKNYKACPLCLGRQHIGLWVEINAIRCPRCKGNGWVQNG